MGEWTQWENAHLAEHEKDGTYLSMKFVFCLGVSVCEIHCISNVS